MSVTIKKGNDESGGAEISSRQRLQSLVMLVLFLSTVLFFWSGELAEEQNPVHVELKDNIKEGNGDISEEVLPDAVEVRADAIDPDDNICDGFCGIRRVKRNEQFGGDLLDRKKLVQLVTTAKANLINTLQVDYGVENFWKIFVDKTADASESSGYRGVIPITLGGESMKRLKRKLQIKVLSMQTLIKKTDSNVNGCDCINGDKALVKNMERVTAESMDIDTTYARYVWATGGHSASAGHGNLYNESYTAFLERDMKDIFGSIGIEFEGRNYAMGGTSSAAEVSMCSEQIFGSDIDFVSWDFGMTDGDRHVRTLHYGYRGGISPGRPAFMGIHIGGRNIKDRLARLRQLEAMGMAVFNSQEESLSTMREGIPDTLGMSEEEISKMPEYVRNLKCDGQFEKGEPHCRDEKFSKDICSPRLKQTAWHPGFKMHAMDGHILGLFLVQTFIDALNDLAENSNQDPEKLLAQLQSEEDQLYQELVQANLPDSAIDLYEVKKDQERDPDVDVNLLFKGPSICHTGRTPAQTRYLGYLTNNGKLGNIAPFGEEKYETGIFLGQANKEDANGVMRLAYTTYREREVCPVVVKPDYKDFFYSHQRDGWVKLTFPNEAEKVAYRYSQSQFKGLLLVCFVACDWGKCPQGDIRAEHLPQGKFEMTVNGKPVKSMVHVDGKGCYVLKGDEGVYWQPSSNSDYEIAVLPKESDGYLRISSIVLY